MDEMTCARCREQLPRYVAGDSAPAERAEVERHIAGCAACRRGLAEWRALAAALREADARIPPDRQADDAWAALQAQLPAARPAADVRAGTTPMRGDDMRGEDMMRDDELDRSHGRRGGRQAGIQFLDLPPAPPSASAPRPPFHAPRGALPAIAATLLVVVLAGALFAAFSARRHPNLGHTPAAPTAAPQVCAPGAIGASLPGGASINRMVMVSPDEGWAVGYVTSAAAGQSTTLILHYQRCQWRPVAQTFPGFSLNDVAMASADEGWASGFDDTGTSTLLLHYSGGRWTRMPTPAVAPTGPVVPEATAQGQLVMRRGAGWVAVASIGKNNQGGWSYGLYQYRDGAWTAVNAPMPGVLGATILWPAASQAISFGPDDAWTIASNNSGGLGDYPAHYHAGQWTTWPLPADESVSQLIMASPQDGWAVGSIAGPSNTPFDGKPLLLHFDGTTWTPIASPAAGLPIQTIQLGSATDGWGFEYTLLPQWDISAVWHLHGGQWQLVPWPFPDVEALLSLVRVSDDEYWAVASYVELAGPGHPSLQPGMELLHYVDGSWSVVNGSRVPNQGNG